jgi:hypothetical protein
LVTHPQAMDGCGCDLMRLVRTMHQTFLMAAKRPFRQEWCPRDRVRNAARRRLSVESLNVHRAFCVARAERQVSGRGGLSFALSTAFCNEPEVA